jgi:probable rRNA maturation factor
MSNIFFYGADKAANVQNKKPVKSLIAFLFQNENVELERVNYIFCSDEYLLKINQQFLQHNTFTDVITFPLSKKGESVYGEIYLSVDRIKENAKSFNAAYQKELLRVMVHGALHLCGYKDKTKSLQQQMRAKENYYLKQFEVSREANI